eukprot:TRINITY_DN5218_c0_g1_i1.p1 TRINITY_DN5218_c0_g1~~TRINITY_DN5218_c0_g1_i1.p1  ORF type:complete len:285 (-),score=35.95 TRINITY_DN5218_c0_g1_i1:31-885(-)
MQSRQQFDPEFISLFQRLGNILDLGFVLATAVPHEQFRTSIVELAKLCKGPANKLGHDVIEFLRVALWEGISFFGLPDVCDFRSLDCCRWPELLPSNDVLFSILQEMRKLKENASVEHIAMALPTTGGSLVSECKQVAERMSQFDSDLAKMAIDVAAALLNAFACAPVVVSDAGDALSWEELLHFRNVLAYGTMDEDGRASRIWSFVMKSVPTKTAMQLLLQANDADAPGMIRLLRDATFGTLWAIRDRVSSQEVRAWIVDQVQTESPGMNFFVFADCSLLMVI